MEEINKTLQHKRPPNLSSSWNTSKIGRGENLRDSKHEKEGV